MRWPQIWPDPWLGISAPSTPVTVLLSYPPCDYGSGAFFRCKSVHEKLCMCFWLSSAWQQMHQYWNSGGKWSLLIQAKALETLQVSKGLNGVIRILMTESGMKVNAKKVSLNKPRQERAGFEKENWVVMGSISSLHCSVKSWGAMEIPHGEGNSSSMIPRSVHRSMNVIRGICLNQGCIACKEPQGSWGFAQFGAFWVQLLPFWGKPPHSKDTGCWHSAPHF